MGKDHQEDEYIKELKKTYREKTIEELEVFRENYIPSEYTPEARKVIEEVFKEREIDFESYINDKKDMESIRPDDYDHRMGDYAVKIQGQYYEIAPLGKRLFGYILDYLIPVLISAIAYSTGSSSLYAICLGLTLLYWLFKDGIKKGKSIGKTIVNIRVVDSKTGNPCNPWESLIRNLSLMLLGLLDILFIFGNKSQRLGDRIASTYVLNDRAINRMNDE